MRSRLRNFLVCTTLLSSSTAIAQGPLELVSPPEVELPFGDAAFPEGNGAQALNEHCLACHSPDHVLNQPSLSRAGWEDTVKKMIRAYKVEISQEDQKRIVDYLTATKGLD